VKLLETWLDFLEVEKEKTYFKELTEKVKNAYSEKIVYPPYKDIFRCFDLCELKNLKVVILGQDPYIKKEQANGLCFSVAQHVKHPPSLVNILKEMNADLNINRQSGDFSLLAIQGILFLNCLMTVEENQVLSHKGFNWEEFTDNVIKYINTIDRPIVFILWGNYAIAKKQFLNNSKHLVLTASHPSPLGAHVSFFGSRCFSRTNEFLRKNNLTEIDFKL